jgi:hypothetical protein
MLAPPVGGGRHLIRCAADFQLTRRLRADQNNAKLNHTHAVLTSIYSPGVLPS